MFALSYYLFTIFDNNYIYSKTCLKQPLKIDKTKILMTNGSLMNVESIAECSPWSILQYFWPELNDSWSWKPIFGLFERGVLDRFYCSLSLVNYLPQVV